MGSAFDAEPLYGVDAREVVTFLMWPDDEHTDLIVHSHHPACEKDWPHRMSECGRFSLLEIP